MLPASGAGLTRRAAMACSLAAAGLATTSRDPAAQTADPWLLASRIRSRIVVPSFPDRTFAISAFGAVGDGRTLCTRAINDAITACSAAGGGRVIVPGTGNARTFLTGAIQLRSNVNLVVETGARLLFSTDPRDYLPVVRTSYEGSECFGYSPFIYASARSNVAVTGGGILDGQASNTFWWPWSGNPARGWSAGMPYQEPDRTNLHAQNAGGVAVGQRVYGSGHYLRPSFLQFRRCTNVLVEGVTIHDGPFWIVHPLLSRSVTIRNITVVSRGPNNDGVDIENCRDVLVTGCTLDTGDDCIAIKSGRPLDGVQRVSPSRYVVIANNHIRSPISAVAFGSEQDRKIQDVFVEDLTVGNANVANGLYFKANRRWGSGVVERVHIRRVSLAGARNAALAVNLRFSGITDGSYLPVVRAINVTEMTCLGSTNALVLNGLAESPVSDVSVSNSSFSNVSGAGVVQSHATGLRLSNVRVNGAVLNS